MAWTKALVWISCHRYLSKSDRIFHNTSDTAPSLNLFYKITPSLNSALTLNTDFSSTEVDSRQVNLTRFNLFFPEKRAFFLQDTDIFEFGRIGSKTYDANVATSQSNRENARAFFSRRLGLSSNGQPVENLVAVSVGGVLAAWQFGKRHSRTSMPTVFLLGEHPPAY